LKEIFIIELAAIEISVCVLAELAGHQSIATTQRHIDINDDMLRNSV
jgi:integrase/recombinase XerD